MLDDAGVTFDFVGGLSSPFAGDSYGCPSPFDQDHEGRWGKRVDQVSDLVTASAEDLQPDVVLIHLGSNDILQGEGPTTTASELESFITSLQTARKDITILIARVIPCDPRSGYESECNDDLPALNDSIASFTRFTTTESSVIVADMETGFSLDDLRDFYHPTDAGDEFMASRWMTALREAGLV